MDNRYEQIDEAMVAFHEQLAAMLEIEGEIKSEEGGFSMKVSEVEVELPLQLDVVVDEDGRVVLGSSPPLYYVDTGMMPVFHSIRFHAVATELEPGEETTSEYER